VKPLATRRAFLRSKVPSGLYLFLRTIRLPITSRSLGRDTSFQVLLRIKDFNSSMIAFLHCCASSPLRACFRGTSASPAICSNALFATSSSGTRGRVFRVSLSCRFAVFLDVLVPFLVCRLANFLDAVGRCLHLRRRHRYFLHTQDLLCSLHVSKSLT